MALKETPYLKLPYNEGGDTGFRELYNQSMDKVDDIFHYPQSIKYPAVMQSTFDASFLAPNTARFDLRPSLSRYVQLGNMVFFEVALDSRVDFDVNSVGAVASTTNGSFGHQIVGTISPAFDRARGFFCTSINGIAASYTLFENTSGQTEIRLSHVGGMSLGKRIPRGTYFGVAGHFMLTS